MGYDIFDRVIGRCGLRRNLGKHVALHEYRKSLPRDEYKRVLEGALLESEGIFFVADADNHQRAIESGDSVGIPVRQPNSPLRYYDVVLQLPIPRRLKTETVLELFYISLKDAVKYAKRRDGLKVRPLLYEMGIYAEKLDLSKIECLYSCFLAYAHDDNMSENERKIAFAVENIIGSRQINARHKMLEGFLEFLSRRPFNGDLNAYMQRYSKGDQPNLSAYSMEPYTYRDVIGLFQDTLLGFVLKMDGSPIACIGFDIEDGGVINVKQIQGNRSSSKSVKDALTPLGRWDRMLLRATADWALEHGFRQVRVQKAENNGYYQKSQPNSERNAKLRMRYNVTPRREGFRFDEETDCFVLDLQSTKMEI